MPGQGNKVELKKQITIAIDGPSGAGKSTVARRLAAELGYTYIDTGAMYRAVAWNGLRTKVPIENEDATTTLAGLTPITFQLGEDGRQHVFVREHDVTDAIRSPEVTRLSSPVSAISGVRRVLVAKQQAMGEGGGVVMEGRDIGTVVFPNAEVKIFLTASEEERARRRWAERTASGDSVSLNDILMQQRERDLRDSSRNDSPLRPAADSITIDSNGLSIEEVVSRIEQIVCAKALCLE
jgi:cytidylate kinase